MKRNKLKYVLMFIAIAASTSFTKTTDGKVWAMSIAEEMNNLIPIKLEDLPLEINELEDFLNDLGHKESRNRYDIVNKYGYMGRYQFSKRTLRGLGFDVSKSEFLSSPETQERAMISLLQHNKELLESYIKEYEGDTIHGVYITESGILAAAHLAGAGNVKKFFNRGYEFKDGFGTKLTTYMENFGGYNLIIE